MSTTSLPPPHPLFPDTMSGADDSLCQKDDFYVSEIVFLRSKRIDAKSIKKFYDLYGKSLDLDMWWVYVAKEYNKQVEYCKDISEEGAYYMFHTKYIGVVKSIVQSTTSNSHIMHGRKLYTIEWEPRNDIEIQDDFITRLSDHFPENLISISNMQVMTKEEILQDALTWAAKQAITKNNL